MFSTIVHFNFKDDMPIDKVRGIATGSSARFKGMQDLKLKAYTINAEANTATNFYLWHSEEAARAFFTDETIAYVAGVYGADVSVEFVELAELVENA